MDDKRTRRKSDTISEIVAFEMGYESHKNNSRLNNPFKKNSIQWLKWNRGFNEFYNSIEYEYR